MARYGPSDLVQSTLHMLLLKTLTLAILHASPGAL